MLDTPVWVEQQDRTVTLCLRTAGCTYAKSTTHRGCLHCELLQLSSENVTINNLVKQVETGLRTVDEQGVNDLNLLVLGSFLDNIQVPLGAITRIGRLLSRGPFSTICLESRPEYITRERIRFLKRTFADMNIEIAVGIESVDDRVRTEYLKKGFTLRDIDQAARCLASEEINFAGYVLLKPPILREREAIEDAIRTSEYIFSLGTEYGIRSRVLLEPYYIPRSNRVDTELIEQYQPVRLWSIIEVLKHISQKGPVRVGLNDEGLSEKSIRNCPKCTEHIMELIRQFNTTQYVDDLDNAFCPCRDEWVQMCGNEQATSVAK